MVLIYINQNVSYEILEGFCDGNTMCFSTDHFSNYSVLYVDKTFDDISNHWGKEAIEALASREIVNGVGNDLFNPDGNISRAEVAQMLWNLINQ